MSWAPLSVLHPSLPTLLFLFQGSPCAFCLPHYHNNRQLLPSKSLKCSCSVMTDSQQPHGLQPTRLLCPWECPGKSTGVGCHCLLQCMKVKSESEVAQSCPTLSDPMDFSLPGSSIHGIFQARVLEWGAITFSKSLDPGYLHPPL